MHAARGKAASGLTVGCDPVIEPARREGRISRNPVSGAPIQAEQLNRMGGASGNQPRRRPGIALGVVRPSPPLARRRSPPACLAWRAVSL